ncbi:MAG TPA: hypothetical protein VNA69_07550 [Thermoanaerobaculia bacterium]|nr:hypothetical protein [Thermoanaerobaculia bacterium]
MRKHLKAVLLALGAFALSCSSYFIAGYDEVIDGGAVALQQKVHAFLIELQTTAGTGAGAYEQHADFYEDVRGDLDVLRNAASLQRGNELTIESLRLIEDNVGRLEGMHAAGISRQEIDVVRTLFDTQFRMLVQLENAKKRKESAP